MKILIVKLSSLGDVVHTLPAAMDIKAHLPEAQIDWVVERAFAPLLKIASPVDNVIECDIRSWRKSFWKAKTRLEFKEFKQLLQKDSYDAIIDLQGLSKSALISWLACLVPGGKRFAIGNQTEGASYEFMTRWVADIPIDVHSRVHAVDRSRIICSKALGYEDSLKSEPQFSPSTPKAPSSLVVTPSKEVLPKTIALIHASSRDDKTWPISYWTVLGEALMQKGFNIALPQGSDTELEQARKISNTLVGSKVWLKMSLDEVSAHLAACVGVIGVDSGLSHIAEALDLPLVQIYNFETDWRTGPIRHDYQTSVYAEPTPSVQEVLDSWIKVWDLYQSQVTVTAEISTASSNVTTRLETSKRPKLSMSSNSTKTHKAIEGNEGNEGNSPLPTSGVVSPIAARDDVSMSSNSKTQDSGNVAPVKPTTMPATKPASKPAPNNSAPSPQLGLFD